ncbi:YcnI family protein [Actinokineospora soli]|uniref:YcnI family protein n=1 Tax=Actinokineospora soli TaxID=1048753 RepID=A0ABW2TMN0_9PSEU
MITRILAAVTTAAALLVLAAQPAAAHVSVSADTPVPGKHAKVTFRVPNERAETSTVRLEVVFPTEQPFGSVSVAPVPGWTAEVVTRPLAAPVQHHGRSITEAVESVTWTGGEIQPGQFVEFPVTLGPLPSGSVVFKSLQTYSDGEVVRWIDTAAGETSHPAPVLQVSEPVAVAPGSDDLARVLGLTGVLVGLAGLIACAAVVPAVRRRPAPARPEPVRETVGV